MRKRRFALLALLVLGLSIAAFMLWKFGTGWMPGCQFRRFTGLECPGCGMTRGTYALFHGRFLEAFAFNPVGMILLPLALVGLAIEAIGWAREKPLPFQLRLGRWGSTIIAVVVVVWWVGRNLF